MNRFDGMTTNERLFSIGELDSFHDALARHDTGKAQRILLKAGFNIRQATWIVETGLKRDSTHASSEERGACP